jgi:hypothetical protein
MPRAVSHRFYVAWDGTNFVDESSRVIQVSGENRLTAPDAIASGRGIVDRCSVELANYDGRYSPLNTGGALYANIQAGGAYHRPMYLSVSINGGSNYYYVFSGVIKLPQESTATSRDVATVRIECRSYDELLLGKRTSTTTANLQEIYAGGYTEADVAGNWLTQAGITATVDSGVYVVPWAWMDDESLLEELWALASATGGRFYCDPAGTYRFEDSTHWLKSPHDTSQETLTRADFAGFEANYNDADLYNVVTVETSPRQVDTIDELWTPDETVIVQPGDTKTVIARFRQAAYSVDTPYFKAHSSGGVDMTSSVTLTVTATNVQRLTMTIANASSTQAAYLQPFYVTGRALSGGPTQEESRDAAAHGNNAAWWTTARGNRTKAIRGNAYIQTRAHAASVALYMLHRSEYPRLTFRLRGVPGNPARRCGDRVTLSDTVTMSAARDAFITAISWRLTRNGFTQDLECIDAANLAPYASEGYFVLGTNKLGASGTGTARIWY